MLWIRSDLQERLGTGREQNLVELFLILQSNGRQLVGYGKNNVIVGNGQKLGSASLHPLSPLQALALWAVSASARVVEWLTVATLVASVQVATELGRAAVANGRHGPSLVQVAAADGELSEDLSQFESHLLYTSRSSRGLDIDANFSVAT